VKTSPALLLGFFLLTPIANAAEPNIWEAPLPPQPSETKPFRPVKVPAWVEETLGVGYTLSAMDSKARAKAAEHGVTISDSAASALRIIPKRLRRRPSSSAITARGGSSCLFRVIRVPLARYNLILS